MTTGWDPIKLIDLLIKEAEQLKPFDQAGIDSFRARAEMYIRNLFVDPNPNIKELNSICNSMLQNTVHPIFGFDFQGSLIWSSGRIRLIRLCTTMKEELTVFRSQKEASKSEKYQGQQELSHKTVIDDLIKQASQLDALDGTQLRIIVTDGGMAIRKIFGKDSHYLQELEDVHREFYPTSYGPGHDYEDQQKKMWPGGKLRLVKLFETMKKDLQLQPGPTSQGLNKEWVEKISDNVKKASENLARKFVWAIRILVMFLLALPFVASLTNQDWETLKNLQLVLVILAFLIGPILGFVPIQWRSLEQSLTERIYKRRTKEIGLSDFA